MRSTIFARFGLIVGAIALTAATSASPAVAGPSAAMIRGQQPVGELDLSREHEASLEWVNSFNDLVDDVRSGWPNDFAGSEIIQSAQPGGTVLFKGDPPAGAIAILATSPVPIDIRGAVGFSESELDAATQAAHFAVVAAVPAGTPIASEGDINSASVTTIVGIGAPLDTPGRVEQLEGLAQDQVAETGGGISVDVRFDPAFETRTEGYGQAGGVRLNPGPCTSGFVVKSRTAPDLGVVTAGHCGNNLTQNGAFAFTFRAEYVGPEGDTQWMRSPVMMDAWFHYDHGLGRPVGGSAIAAVDQQIYKYGVATGRTTSTVRSTNACLNSTCNLFSTNEKISEGGDSGGPWYIGTTAYGTHVGSSFNPFSSSSYYQPIRRALDRFGLNLCISVNNEPQC